LFQDESRPSLDQQVEKIWGKTSPTDVEALLAGFEF